MTQKQRHRVQLDLSDKAFTRLGQLRKNFGFVTNAETVRNALRMLDWLWSARKDGWKIHLARDDEVKEVEFIFDHQLN